MTIEESDLITAAVATATAVFGGVARWYADRLFQAPFQWGAFLLDMLISAGVGVLAFYVVLDLGQPQSFAAVASAISGNIGSRCFDIARMLIRGRVKKAADNEDEPKQNP